MKVYERMQERNLNIHLFFLYIFGPCINRPADQQFEPGKNLTCYSVTRSLEKY